MRWGRNAIRNWSGHALGVCILLFALALAAQAQVPISYKVSGSMGSPAVSGPDPLNLAGSVFQLSGSIASDSVPTSLSADSATYNFPDISITILSLTVDVPNVPVTFSLPAGGVPRISFSASINVGSINLPVSAVLALPANTFTSFATPPTFASTNISPGTDPVLGSTLTYGIGDNLTVLSVTGTVAGINVGPTIAANPSALSFGYLIGGLAPLPQTFAVNAGSNIPVSVATDGTPWISATAMDSSTPTVVTVSVDSTGLAPGVYTSQLTLTSPGASNSPLVVPVQFVVSNPPPPNAASQYPPVNRGEFVEAVPQGFGDRQNGWAWSMEWFKDKLYVGSNRAFDCVQAYTIKVVFPITPYPPWDTNIDCAADVNDLALQAEIWAWTPDTNSWARVFQSPLTIPNPDSDKPTNRLLPPDIGFRGLQVYTEADGTQALYVSGVSSKSIHKFANPDTGVPAAPGARMMRTVDGVNFTPIQSPTSILVTGNYASFRGMTVLNNCLYVIAGDLTGAGVVLGSCNPSDPDSWALVSPAGTQYFEIATYNNALYATQSGVDGFNLIKSDGSGFPNLQFTTVIPLGGYRTLMPNQSALSMKVFNGDLYVGGNGIHSFFGAEMYRVHPDDTWDLIEGMPRDTPVGYKAPLSGLGPGFGWFLNAHIWRMEVFDGRLYAGTFDLSTTFRGIPFVKNLVTNELGFDLWWTADGVNWALVDQNGLGDKFNFGVRSLKKTDWGFFLGTANFYYGLRIYRAIPPGFNFPPLVNPSNPQFSATVGSTTPISQNLQISSAGNPSTFTVTSAVTSPGGGNWLQVSSGSMTPPTSPASVPLTVTANPTGLPVGKYVGVITFANSAVGVQRQIEVTLNITPPSSVSLAPAALTFNYVRSSPTLPAPQTLLASAGGSAVNYVAGTAVANPTGGSWLQVTPSSGIVPLPGSTNLQVSVNPEGLPFGVYTGTVTVNGASQGPQQVPVTLNVTPGKINFAGGIALEFAFSGGGANPAPVSLPISTNGDPFDFTVSVNSGPATSSGSLMKLSAATSGWLKVGPMSGTAPTAPKQTFITVSADIASLPPGRYSGSIEIDAVPPAMGSATVHAFLVVNPPATPPGQTTTPPPGVAASQTVVQLENGGGWRSSAVMVNTGAKSAPVTMNFWGYDGKALSLPLLSGGPAATFTGSVPSGGLLSVDTDGSGAGAQQGWSTLNTEGAIGGSVILTSQAGVQAPSEVALPLIASPSRNLMIPFDETGASVPRTTTVALTNTGTKDATAVLTFMDESGTALPITGTVVVPANGHFSGDVGAMYPPLLGKRGVIRVSSPAALAGTAFRFNGWAYTALPALSNVPSVSKTIPHLVNGLGWTSSIFLVNAGSQPAQFTLHFYGSDGNPVALPLGGDGTVSTLSGTLAPGQLRVIETDGSGSGIAQASAALSASGAIGGTAIFTAPATGLQGPSEAASPLTSYPALTLYLPFEQNSDLDLSTTIELANPGESAAKVNLSFAGADGSALSPSAAVTIPAHGHYETALADAFPQLAGIRGVVKITSSTGLSGLAIRHNGDGFTSIPAIVPGGSN